MNGRDELRQENAALRERISRLNAAILRINAGLDLDTVLHEVVDSARALTGARYGMYLLKAPGAQPFAGRAAGARAGAALPPSSAREPSPSPSPSSPWSPRCRCVRRVGSSRVSRRCVVSVPVSCTLPRRCVVAAHCLYRRQGGARASTRPPAAIAIGGGRGSTPSPSKCHSGTRSTPS